MKNNILPSHTLQFVVLMVSLFVGVTISPVYANPQGGSVVAGQATITAPTATQTVIHQATDKAIINWDQFNIQANEHTQFIQPSASSIALNRVTGNDPSKIFGQLSANGQIVLVNPNGIVFGPDSKVDVAALIATTNDIQDADFMAGRMNFAIPGKLGAQVINQGTITVQEGGLVALVSPSIHNSGIIQARLGKVVLASANTFTLDLYGDDLILFSADSTVTEQLQDAFGTPLDSAIEQSGVIEADGGYVLLTTDVVKNVVDNAINMTGIIKAQSAEMQGGTIILNAGAGSATVAGTIDALGVDAAMGGEVRVIAEDALTMTDSTIITAAGGSQGGDGGFIALAGGSTDITGSYSVKAGDGNAENGWLYVGNNTDAAAIMCNPNLDGAGVQPDQATVLFEENLGQTDDSVDFLTRADNAIMYLTAADAVVAMQTGEDTFGSMGLSLVGASDDQTVAGENEQQSYSNYYIGNDETQWVEGAKHFGAVRYANVYDGIDLIYYGNKNGDIEYDLVVATGADPSQIALDYTGASSVVLNDLGDLVITLGAQTVVQKAPLAYQVEDDAKVIVPSRYVMGDDEQVTVQSDVYNVSQVLIVDPVVKWSSFFGGTGNDRYADVAVDSNYSLVTTGQTYSSDLFYYQQVGGFDTSYNPSGTDAFIAKLSSDGTLIWSTYYGGDSTDVGHGIDTNSDDDIYVAGYTYSSDFADSYNYLSESGTAFLTKLSSDGSLLWSRRFGSDYWRKDSGNGVAVDQQDNVYLTGKYSYGSSASYVFLNKYSSEGDVLWSETYKFNTSGSEVEQGADLEIDSQGNPVIVGSYYFRRSEPYSCCFTTFYTTSYDWNAFILKYSSTGEVLWSRSLTGYKDDVYGLGLAIDSQDNAIVTGYTLYEGSSNLSTVGAFDTTPQNGWDSFVSKFSSSGALLWSTYLGGEGEDRGYDVAVDSQDHIFVTGKTSSSDFYSLYSDGTSFSGDTDAFLAEFSPEGSLLWTQYIGGSSADVGNGVTTDPLGNVFVVGETSSSDFNTSELDDVGFVTKVDLALNVPAELSGSLSFSFDEGSAAISLFPSASIIDSDSDNHLVSAEISIISGFDSINDLLLFNDHDGIDSEYDPTLGILTLTGIATIEDYETAIRSIRFSNESKNPLEGERVISLTVNDIEENSPALYSTVHVAPINDVPAVNNSSNITFIEKSSGIDVFSEINLEDVDNAKLTSATVQITNGFFTAEDMLLFTTQNGISGNYDPDSGVLELSGDASVADYQTAIRSIQYNNGSDNPDISGRTVTIIVNDGEDNSSPLASRVAITPINDAPTLNTDVYGGNTVTGGVQTGNVDIQSNNGVLVSDLLVSGLVADVDSSTTGIAVTSLDSTGGTWEYSLSGSNWLSVPAVSDGSALLLSADAHTSLRFVPSSSIGTTTIARAVAFFAWDGSFGANGDTGVDANTRGTTTAYSTDWGRGYLSLNDPAAITAAAIAEVERLAAIAEAKRLAAIAEAERLVAIAEAERLAAIAEAQRLAELVEIQRLKDEADAIKAQDEAVAATDAVNSSLSNDIIRDYFKDSLVSGDGMLPSAPRSIPKTWDWLTETQLLNIARGAEVFGASTGNSSTELMDVSFSLMETLENLDQSVGVQLEGVPDYQLADDISLGDLLSSNAKINVLADTWNNNIPFAEQLSGFSKSFSPAEQERLEGSLHGVFDYASDNIDSVNDGEYGRKGVWALGRESFGRSALQLYDVIKTAPIIAKYEAKFFFKGADKAFELFDEIRDSGEKIVNSTEDVVFYTKVLPKASVACLEMAEWFNELVDSGLSEEMVARFAVIQNDFLELIPDPDSDTKAAIKNMSRLGDLIELSMALNGIAKALDANSFLENLPEGTASSSTIHLIQGKLTTDLVGDSLQFISSSSELVSSFINNDKIETLAEYVADIQALTVPFTNSQSRLDSSFIEKAYMKYSENIAPMEDAINFTAGGYRVYSENLGKLSAQLY